MHEETKKMLFIIFLLGLFMFISGCTQKEYVCADGRTVSSPELCNSNNSPNLVPSRTNVGVTVEQINEYEECLENPDKCNS